MGRFFILAVSTLCLVSTVAFAEGPGRRWPQQNYQSPPNQQNHVVSVQPVTRTAWAPRPVVIASPVAVTKRTLRKTSIADPNAWGIPDPFLIWEEKDATGRVLKSGLAFQKGNQSSPYNLNINSQGCLVDDSGKSLGSAVGDYYQERMALAYRKFSTRSPAVQAFLERRDLIEAIKKRQNQLRNTDNQEWHIKRSFSYASELKKLFQAPGGEKAMGEFAKIIAGVASDESNISNYSNRYNRQGAVLYTDATRAAVAEALKGMGKVGGVEVRNWEGRRYPEDYEDFIRVVIEGASGSLDYRNDRLKFLSTYSSTIPQGDEMRRQIGERGPDGRAEAAEARLQLAIEAIIAKQKQFDVRMNEYSARVEADKANGITVDNILSCKVEHQRVGPLLKEYDKKSDFPESDKREYSRLVAY